MVRPDVPILVRPGDDNIELIGTKPQQAIFRSFVEMINHDKDTTKRAYRLSEGKVDMLYELMARSDVAIMVSRNGDEIIVHGRAAEHAVFESFVNLIDPKSDGSARYVPSASYDLERAVKLEQYASQADETAKMHAHEAEIAAKHHAMQAEEMAKKHAYESQMKAQERVIKAERRAKDRAIKAEKRATERTRERAKRRERTERRIDRSSAGVRNDRTNSPIGKEDLAELLRHASDVISEHDAQSLASQLVVLSDREHLSRLIRSEEDKASELLKSKTWLFSRAKELESNAKTLAIQAEAAERQADSVRAQIEVLEAKAERAEVEAEMIEDRADEIEEESASGRVEKELAAQEAELFAAKAKQLDAEARQIVSEAAALEVEAEHMDQQASELEVKAAALAELVGMIVSAVDGVEEYLGDVAGA